MRTVYVVSSGQYSDYGIIAVFLDKQRAEQFVTEYNKTDKYDSADIEEWNADEVPAGDLLFEVDRWFTLKDGVMTEKFYTEIVLDPDRIAKIGEVKAIPSEAQDWGDWKTRKNPPDKKVYTLLTVYVEADTVERAVKVAREKFDSYRVEKGLIGDPAA